MGLDTRLGDKLLLDPKLQRRLSAEEFKSFINLLVYSVQLRSDGVFDPDDVEMIMDAGHLVPLEKHGLIERCEDSGLFRIHPDYQQWQTSKAQLDGLAEKKKADAARKRAARQREPEPEDDMQPQAPWG